MPDIRSLTPLFEAIAHRDWESSKETALEIVAKEESKGNRKAARQLRGALNGCGGNSPGEGSGVQHENGKFLLSRALVRCPEGPNLDRVALRTCARRELREILDEWRAAKALDSAGLPRRSRLLFHGPPGCGKTISALALAKEIGLPAYVVRFNALIGSYLGQTALNLSEIFRFAAQSRCVLILDEIDVLGKKRGNQMDVGELDRIVVGLMQELDLTVPKGLVIGATNLSIHLDEALWRRFDLQLEFPKPTKTEILSFARKQGKNSRVAISAGLKKKLEGAGSYADAEKSIMDLARQAVVKKHLANAKRAADM